MADTKSARRDAERAAQALLETTMVKAAGELGVAAAARADAVSGVDGAKARGAELVTEAQRQAEQLVSAAQQNVATADATYTTAWNEAIAAGWSPDALTNLGHTAPGSPSRRRSNRRAKTAVSATQGTHPTSGAGAADAVDDVA